MVRATRAGECEDSPMEHGYGADRHLRRDYLDRLAASIKPSERGAYVAEPAWIAHDGSAACPVPAGHDVEVRLGDGRELRDDTPQYWVWKHANGSHGDITHYRDWTAYEEQQRMSRDDVPENPSAFPHLEPRDPTFSYCQNGMTLRDWFAGQAFGVAVGQARGLGSLGADERAAIFKQVAEIVYEAADAMLRARLTNAGTMKGE